MIPRLVAISPNDGRDLAPWILALGAAGLPALLLREPGLSEAALEELAWLAAGVVDQVVLHDRNPAARGIARRFGMAVHVRAGGERPVDLPWTASAHDAEEADLLLECQARWVLLSPVWAPGSKPGDARPILGAEAYLDAARGRALLALGGVDEVRYAELRAAGAPGAAVLGRLFGAPDPEEAAARLRRFLDSP